MVSLFDLALDHLGGDLHRHTADLVLDLVDRLLALLRNVGLGLLLIFLAPGMFMNYLQ